jgi:FtsP/CotA-like multicopper oxidase with cupredoxin domain
MSSAESRKVEEHALLPIGRHSNDGSDLSLSEGEDEDWEVISKRPKEKRRILAPRKWIIFLMVVSALIAFGAATTWRLRKSPATSDNLRQDAEDEYLLSPEWDFNAGPQERHFHWNITDKVINPDGVFRPMILINEQFPGPLVRCNEGDRLVIHIDNQATNATSFHWHGLYQNGTNWMDGTVGISQCPIAPGAQFVYNFTVSGQHGSYWYHAHQSVQASDGLFGPLIIHSKDEKKLQPLKYSTDRVVMVHDHYYNLTSELIMKYLAPGRENTEPVPDTALINGKNVRDCTTAPSRRCDSSSTELQNFILEKNQNHRLRFINVGAFAEFQIQIDEHEFAVTEIDGIDVASDLRYHRLNILPAQRYSIILTTNVTSLDSFWLRARMVTTCFAEENLELQPEARAIIQYTTSSSLTPHNVAPTSKDWSEVVELECRDLDTSSLHPVIPIEAPAIVDFTVNLRSNFEIGDWRLSRGWLNSSSYRPNIKSPTLHRIMHGLQTDDNFFDTSAAGPSGKINLYAFNTDRELVFQTTGIATIDIVVSNFDDGAHPFHLHGYKFFVLAAGRGYFDYNYSNINITNPLRRDTATVEAFGWVLIRFIADNPGIWPFHCHVAWHTEAGLLMQFWTRSEEMKGWTLPEKNKALCEMEGVEKGGGPDDEIWFGPMEMKGLGSVHKVPPPIR